MDNVSNNKNKTSLAITIFAIGIFMAALDNGIISAALTTINNSFNVSPSWGAWGITLYTLGLAVSVPIVGKLSDRFGRKKLFLIEVILFGIGSLFVALSTTFPMFLAARLFQSLGGGGIFIIGSSYVLDTLPVEKQGKMLGLLGGMNGIAAVLGPNVGSLILDITNDWHWLFLINIPIAILLIVAGYYYIDESFETKRKPLDFIGALILSFSILLIMLAITNLDSNNFVASILDISFWGFIILGILLFIILIFYERKLEIAGKDPIILYSLLTSKVFQWTLIIGFFSGGIMASMIFIPAFSELVLGISATKSGYWLTPLALASGVGAGLGGYSVDKSGPVKTILIAGTISLIGFVMFALFVTTKFTFIIASCIAGVGVGFLLGAPLNVLITENAGDNKGSTLGTLSLIRQIGMTLSPTIYAGFLTAGMKKIGPTVSLNEAMTSSFGYLYLTVGIIAGLIIISALILAYYRNKPNFDKITQSS